MMKMVKYKVNAFVVALVFVVCAASAAIDDGAEKLYVVQMDKSQMPSTFPTPHHWYKSLLSSISISRDADVDAKLVYTYDVVMHGFSAKLTRVEVEALRAAPGHVESHEDSFSAVLDTTYSYTFLGLTEKEGLWPQTGKGGSNDVIVGVLDTGIWPENPCFADNGMGPVPAKWKGICQPGTEFDPSLCNRKLIGARYFNKGFLAKGRKVDPVKDYDSARDYSGHGTSSASIVAGNVIPDADFFGYGNGIAQGMASRARVAMYKVGWYDGGRDTITESDIYSGVEQAMADGVDIISASFGAAKPPKSYLQDPLVTASLTAVQNGVLVVGSSGNSGPRVYTVINEGPWMLTVGATTIDRAFVARINIGDGQIVMSGTSIFRRRYATPDLAIVAGNTCPANSLDPRFVAGNILFCLDSDDVNVRARIREAQRAGALAAILAYKDAVDLPSSAYVIPSVFVNSNQSETIVSYLNSTSTPIARVEFVITELGTARAPALASFSSVGPSRLFPEIIKPDIVGPGVNIIAACPPKRKGNTCFTLSSGTSASAPHVAGIAALLKAAHPDWSPAFIKSALMTTASKLDNTGNNIAPVDTSAPALSPLDIGSGHVDPERASDPGLVYDVGYQDYVNYLCLTKRKTGSDCDNASGSPYDLNLASFAGNFCYATKEGENQTIVFKRSVTNVGGGDGVYHCQTYPPEGVNVTVVPDTLVFNQTTKTLGFTLTMKILGKSIVMDRVRYGFLLWYDNAGPEDHEVVSPIVAIFPYNYNQTVL